MMEGGENGVENDSPTHHDRQGSACHVMSPTIADWLYSECQLTDLWNFPQGWGAAIAFSW